ncbi:hypothetical protein [Aquicoccus sp.]|uniref:hypothetical protein n=1 Tax=Aquicoccus sp. TaxID=2055851 RepID=UPI003562C668
MDDHRKDNANARGRQGEQTPCRAFTDAKAAVGVFIYRCRPEFGSLAAALGGLDALVFTGGVGENTPAITEGICAELGWLGVGIDHKANTQGASRISHEAAKVDVYMIPTDEERVLARGACEFLRNVKGAGD